MLNIFRIDMQIDWLDFALNNTNLSEPEMMEFRKKKNLQPKTATRFFYLVEDSLMTLLKENF